MLDTNVFLDFMMGRDNGEAGIIFQMAGKENAEFAIASSITDIYYLYMKALKNDDANEFDRRKRASFQAQEQVSNILEIITLLPVLEENVKDALALRWIDFEDALQYVVALSYDIDVIVTNNVKDFESSEIKIVTPKEFIEKTQ